MLSGPQVGMLQTLCPWRSDAQSSPMATRPSQGPLVPPSYIYLSVVSRLRLRSSPVLDKCTLIIVSYGYHDSAQFLVNLGRQDIEHSPPCTSHEWLRHPWPCSARREPWPASLVPGGTSRRARRAGCCPSTATAARTTSRKMSTSMTWPPSQRPSATTAARSTAAAS